MWWWTDDGRVCRDEAGGGHAADGRQGWHPPQTASIGDTALVCGVQCARALAGARSGTGAGTGTGTGTESAHRHSDAQAAVCNLLLQRIACCRSRARCEVHGGDDRAAGLGRRDLGDVSALHHGAQSGLYDGMSGRGKRATHTHTHTHTNTCGAVQRRATLRLSVLPCLARSSSPARQASAATRARAAP